jgi:anti-anti-sigma regulatory factor
VLRAQAGASTLTVDLGGVWFLDVAGLRVLLDAAAAAQAAGGRRPADDRAVPPIVPRMLALLELEDALGIEPALPAVAVMASYRARARSRAR